MFLTRCPSGRSRLLPLPLPWKMERPMTARCFLYAGDAPSRSFTTSESGLHLPRVEGCPMAEKVSSEQGQIRAVMLAQRAIKTWWWQRHLRDKGARGKATRISYRTLTVEMGVGPGCKTALAECALVRYRQEIEHVSRTMTPADMCKQLMMSWKANTTPLAIWFFDWTREQCGSLNVCTCGI